MSSPATLEAHPRARASTSSHARSSRSSARSCSRCSCSPSTRPSSARPCRSSSPSSTATTLYTWAVTIYLLTSTISGPIYGKLSDLYGRRPIFIWAVGLFLVASIFAGLSQEMWQFILVPRPPGPRRRRGLPDRARGHRRPLPARGAGQVRRAVRGGVRAVVGARAGHRRLHHRQLRLALDLLPQRADRAGLAVRLLAAAAADQASREPAGTSTTSARRLFTGRPRPVPDRPDEQAARSTGPIPGSAA